MSSMGDPRQEEEIIRMDIDLEIGHGPIGFFTIDLTTNPFMHLGHIRSEIGAALGLSLEDFVIKSENTVVSDSYVAKIYLEEVKGFYSGNYLRLDINLDKQREVAIKLQSRIREDPNVHDIGVSIVMEGLTEAKDIILTIYKPCFDLYVNKFL